MLIAAVATAEHLKGLQRLHNWPCNMVSMLDIGIHRFQTSNTLKLWNVTPDVQVPSVSLFK